MFAFVGWLIGFKGNFLFETIGTAYKNEQVPYVGMRALPALLGSINVPLMFQIMRIAGYNVPASLISAIVLLFDNAHICDDRLILLDASLVFFVTTAIKSYLLFYKCRSTPFSMRWWRYLLQTGFFLSSITR